MTQISFTLGMSRAHVARFVLICLIFILIQIIVLATGWAGLQAINTTRAYATGESLYSKGQKAAVLGLYRYAHTGDDRYLSAFYSSIRLPLGDRIAREALDRPDPDFETAAAGLRQSRTNPTDIPNVMRLFRLFRHWGPFKTAVEDWHEGDRLVNGLVEVAEEIRDLQQDHALTDAKRDQLTTQIDKLDAALSDLEYVFSEHLGDAARSATNLVISLMCSLSVALWSAGLWLAWRTYSDGIESDIQLKESEARFRDFAEIASDWFWQTDDQLRISYLSERFAEATGVPPDELLGKTTQQAGMKALGQIELERHRQDLGARRSFRRFVYRYVSPDATEQYWAVSGVPVLDAQGRFLGYRGTGTNITDEIRSKQALEEARAQSEAASRAKSEFLATMSHELRTPLNAIIGYSEIIKDRLYGEAPLRYADYANDIFVSGKHLLAIINDILDISKIEAGRAELNEESIDIKGLIESIAHLLRQKIQAGKLGFNIELPDRLPPIFADERKLKQVFMNLLSNAIKFTPAGGVIRVFVSQSTGDLRVEIRDTGIGMAANEIPKALALFGQVDSGLARKHEGTGLGLPLARALVELHGGDFELVSEPGRGTSAIVTLPARRFSLAAAE